MSRFEQNLQDGKLGESLIAQWLKASGYNILPVYEIEKDQYAGPAVYACDGRKLVAPDLLAINREKMFWIEAKHKSAFSWHRNTQRWVTGIDLHHYRDYLEVDKLVPFPVWLFFLHKGLAAKDSGESESGLFANALEFLEKHENHRHKNHGKTGMVYWSRENLKKMDTFPFGRK